jgi:hypothetical protein
VPENASTTGLSGQDDVLINGYAAAVSLVLCVATVALWVRSYWRSDLVKRSRWDYNGGSINKQLDERT